MADLSPAAQAVLAALTQNEYGLDPADIPREAGRMAFIAAAALRAAAEQVVPAETDLPPIAPDLGHFRQHERRLIRQRFLAIAAELEAKALPGPVPRDPGCDKTFTSIHQ